MNRSDARLMAGSVLAVTVPAMLLHFTTSADRLAVGLTAAPFAWPRVLVAHLITALPLGFLLASWMRSVASVNEAARGMWLAIALALAGFAALIAPGIGESLAAGVFGESALLVLRSALATALVLPWCVWATDPLATPQPNGRPGLRFALCAGIAIVPCGLYADAAITSRTATANEHIALGRLVKAEHVLTGLVELGSDRPVAQKSPGELRQTLRKEIERLEKNASYPLLSSAAREARLSRCVMLIQLNRLDEAADVLQPIMPANTTDVTATLLLATIYRDSGQWAASDAAYETALVKLLPEVAASADARQSCRLAFDGLAYNARMDRRTTDVERVLQRGLELLPPDAAYFYFQLGQHYANTGRPTLAIEHLTRATELDPTAHREPAEKLIQQLRTATPICVLPRN